MPKVSIAIPTYEPQKEHLEAALQSLLSQTETDWECIIHDDASNIDVKAMVEQYLSDPRFHFRKSEKRLGIAGNWNACLRFGRADYVQYLFQDDVWDTHYLANALELAEENRSISFVATQHQYQFDDNHDVDALRCNAEQDQYEKIFTLRTHIAGGIHRGPDVLKGWMDQGLHPNWIGEPSFVLIRRRSLEDAGPFCKSLPQLLDTDMWTRLLLVGDLGWVEQNGGAFRVHHLGASAENKRSGKGMYDRLRVFDRLIDWLEGDEKKQVVDARNSAFEGMARKFMRRQSRENVKKQSEDSIQGSVSRIQKILNSQFSILNSLHPWMVGFALRHPVLVGKTLVKMKK